MKKYLIIALLAVSALIYLVFFSTSGEDITFKRITLPVNSLQQKVDFGGNEFSVKTDSRQQRYLFRPRFSIKGQHFILEEKNFWEISPELKGDYFLSLKISAKSDQIIEFEICQNQDSVHNQILSFVQNITLDQPLNLKKSDSLSIEFRGKGKVIIEDLFLFTKSKEKKYSIGLHL